ncbi:CRISPR-associated endonuclease Cas2|uniref:CRISPR-associated endoribonuclease Cas2 n=1 Tax=Dendrosporobacter quercicolus TaxID=146817 RepID=A0A1G9U6Q7_9FIRM|nr:CRISPR-associated endonuclease Cas2 [Dendrosporobacter quercicolus]NSL48748.1 CRISPR-associated endonuclease Cas2 [Dendrosporobacter quercicolus DSM 1736]SDM55245.1 CRISPR-associated protein, Cas2 family [Dendrosporobacter quercicolus]
MSNVNYNYAFIFYDIGEKRVQKVFKICKRYFKHHQKSVFRGHITPANLIELKNELNKIIDKEEDFITVIKLKSKADFSEDVLGSDHKKTESLII